MITADPDRPRRLLEEVLARPEFHLGGGGSPDWTRVVVTAAIAIAAVLLLGRLVSVGARRGSAVGDVPSRSRRIPLGLLLLAVGGLALGILWPPFRPSERDSRVSIASAAPRGARALYLWLGALGYPTRAWRQPLTAVGPAQRALFVLDPIRDITPAQRDALAAWVSAGGTLFLSPGADTSLLELTGNRLALEDDPTAASDVRGDRIVPDNGERWRYREATPDERGLYDYPVEEVAVRGTRRVRDREDGSSALFARDGLGLLAEVYQGDGMIVLFPEADLLTNRGLPKAHNAELIASLVEDWIPAGTEIWFDEYDHGARDRPAGS